MANKTVIKPIVNMRTITIQIPVDVVCPVSYRISVDLNGDSSLLVYEETYPPDVPAQLIDNTIVVIQTLLPTSAQIAKLTDSSIHLKLTGTEYEILSFIKAEFNAVCPSSDRVSVLSSRGEQAVIKGDRRLPS